MTHFTDRQKQINITCQGKSSSKHSPGWFIVQNEIASLCTKYIFVYFTLGTPKSVSLSSPHVGHLSLLPLHSFWGGGDFFIFYFPGLGGEDDASGGVNVVNSCFTAAQVVAHFSLLQNNTPQVFFIFTQLATFNLNIHWFYCDHVPVMAFCHSREEEHIGGHTKQSVTSQII